MTSRTMTVTAITFFLCVGAASVRAGEDGLVRLKSQFDVPQTVARLVEIVKKKGLKHFTTIDHAAGARAAGLSLPPTRVVMFGNPKIGTPLMHCSRTVAIDLPQKVLVWAAPDGSVWLAYNNPAFLHERHGLAGCEKVIAKVTGALAGLTAFAAGSQ